MHSNGRFWSRARRIAVLTVLSVAAASLHAQGPTLSSSQVGVGRCTYDSCALRLDRTFFGTAQVVSGLDGPRANLGLFGGGLADLVSGVPDAALEAQKGRRNAIKAFVAGLVLTYATVLAIEVLAADDILEVSDSNYYGSLALGAISAPVLAVQSRYAGRHFSRAVWLYNRELPR